MVIYLLLFLLPTLAYINLVRNGDLQNYQANISQMIVGSNEMYQYFPSDISQWYSLNSPNIQIKNRIDLFTTFCLELATTKPITVCQDILLTPQKKYQLNYSAFCQQIIYKINFTVYANEILISFLYIQQHTVNLNKTDYFYSQSGIDSYRICFNQSHLPVPPRKGLQWVGGFVDNISIVQAELHQINFIITPIQNISLIRLTSDLRYNLTLIEQFQRQHFLQISGIALQNTRHKQNSDGFLQLEFNVNFNFRDDQAQFKSTRIQPINQMIYFQVRIQPASICFYALSDSSKSILVFYRQVAMYISKQMQTAVNFLKFTSCSYLLLTLVNFENLILFYSFLNLRAVPEFTKQIYYDMLNSNIDIGSFSRWLEKINFIKQSAFNISIESENIPEVIDQTKNSSKWFGLYGFSSLILTNNTDFLIIFGFLIVKLAVINTLLKLISKQKRRQLGLSICWQKILLVEFICNIPSLMISSQSRTLESAGTGGEILEKCGQLLVWFLCLIALAVYTIIGRTVQKNLKGNKQQHTTSSQWKNNIKGRQKHTESSRPQFKYQNSECKSMVQQRRQPLKKNLLLLNIKQTYKPVQKVTNAEISYLLQIVSIPFFSIFCSPKLFIIANSFVFTSKIILCFCECRNNNLGIRIIEFAINLVWIVHHIIFALFLAIDTEQVNGVDPLQKYPQMLVILGIGGLFTVFGGYILQALKFLISIVKILIKIGILLKKCGESQKVHPYPELKKKQRSDKDSSKKKQVKELIMVQPIINDGIQKQKQQDKQKKNGDQKSRLNKEKKQKKSRGSQQNKIDKKYKKIFFFPKKNTQIRNT